MDTGNNFMNTTFAAMDCETLAKQANPFDCIMEEVPEEEPQQHFVQRLNPFELCLDDDEDESCHPSGRCRLRADFLRWNRVRKRPRYMKHGQGAAGKQPKASSGACKPKKKKKPKKDKCKPKKKKAKKANKCKPKKKVKKANKCKPKKKVKKVNKCKPKKKVKKVNKCKKKKAKKPKKDKCKKKKKAKKPKKSKCGKKKAKKSKKSSGGDAQKVNIIVDVVIKGP